ncbi:MAG: ATP-binding protein [Pseudomonadota bacterium]
MTAAEPGKRELDAIRKEAIAFAGIGLYRYRFDGTVLFMDRGAMRILGLVQRHSDPEELVGRQIGDLILYAGPRGYLRESIREQGHVRNLEYPFQTLDGEERWALHDSYLVRGGETGEDAIQVIIRDITARKRAELALGAERERLAVTLRSIGDGVITTDIDGRITLLNRVAEELTGWTSEEALGSPLTEVFRIINERTRATCENPVEKVLRTGLVVGLANHTALVARDGTERLIADSGAAIRDPRSQVIGVVLVFRDVTEQSRLEVELQRIGKLDSIGILAGGIAHDFNNLLTSILGNVALSRMYLDPHTRAQELLEKAERAILRAKDLTLQLLTFARGGAPVRQATSIRGIVRESASFALSGSSVLCEYDIPPDLDPADVDPGQLSQVIHNLVLNAVQAMPDGGRVEIACRNHQAHDGDGLPLAPGAYLRISIRDDGPGIPSDQVAQVFDPYFTTKDRGSGLGLAVAHAIVSKHDGHIRLDSQQNRGTTVEIYLPAVPGEAVADDQPIGPITDGTGRILVMDDEPALLEVAAQMLHHLGYEATAVPDGAAALEAFDVARSSGQSFDVVILDLTVPGGMGGAEVVRKLLGRDPAVRAIASSGYSSDPIMANYRSFGFRAVLPKPYSLVDLSRALANACLDAPAE